MPRARQPVASLGRRPEPGPSASRCAEPRSSPRWTRSAWSRRTWSSPATGSPRSAPRPRAWPGATAPARWSLPGNVCAHHHLYSALSRGMPYRLEAPRNFLQILQRIWWRLDRALDEPTVRLSALVGGLDALRAGTTTVIDHHASPNFIDGSLDVIAGRAGRTGPAVGALLRGHRPGRAADGPRRGWPRTGGSWPAAPAGARHDGRPRVVHACATTPWPRAPRPPRPPASGVHIHVAEDGADQQDAEAAYGVRVDRAAGPGRRADPGRAAGALRPRQRAGGRGHRAPPVRPSRTTRAAT